MRPKVARVLVAVLLWAALEVAVVITVARLLGVGLTLSALLLMSLAGVVILRYRTRRFITTWQERANAPGLAQPTTGTAAGRVRGAGVVSSLGAVLLAIPGFVSGVIGAFLLVPVVNRVVARRAVGRLLNGRLGLLGSLPFPGFAGGSAGDQDRDNIFVDSTRASESPNQHPVIDAEPRPPRPTDGGDTPTQAD